MHGGPWGPFRVHGGGLLKTPKVIIIVQNHFHTSFLRLLGGWFHYFLNLTYSLCLWGLWGSAKVPPGSDFELGTTFQKSYSHNDVVENFIVIQSSFAEIFVLQDFTVRTTPGLNGPANTCEAGLLVAETLVMPTPTLILIYKKSEIWKYISTNPLDLS